MEEKNRVGRPEVPEEEQMKSIKLSMDSERIEWLRSFGLKKSSKVVRNATDLYKLWIDGLVNITTTNPDVDLEQLRNN